MFNFLRRRDVIRINFTDEPHPGIDWTPEELAEIDAEFSEWEADLDADMAAHQAELERIRSGYYDYELED